jgi:antitoxin component of MazEF toxin-antitoxin module
MNCKRTIVRRAGAGNSLNTTIPSDICRIVRLQKDTVVDIEVQNGKIIMTPIAGLTENKEHVTEQMLTAQGK